MKLRICLAGSLLAILLLIRLPISQAVEDPAARSDDPLNSITQVSDSVVNYVLPDHVETGTAFDICFHTTVNSPDLEYMDRLEVDLPDDWTVNEVYVEPEASGCDGSTEADYTLVPDLLIYWQTDQPMPTYCGPWNNGTYDFCANVTVPDSNGGPWFLEWSIIGDYYGSEPHSASGILNPISCQQPSSLYLSPNTYFLIDCHTLTHTLTMNLDNQTGYADTFDLAYDVPGNRGSITGPDGIYLGDGVDQDFLVELASDPCLPAGTQISATVQAAGGGMYTGAFVWMTTTRGGTCPVCYDVFLPLVLNSQ
ncbi:MAG: hypothetical protein PVI59_17720 [Anaerolineae bacterium]|jgi:hypothetical protein